ncbi:unnamed protein product [Rhodiola kirilowii]
MCFRVEQSKNFWHCKHKVILTELMKIYSTKAAREVTSNARWCELYIQIKQTYSKL